MDSIDKYIIESINKKNNAAIADFEGYSPSEMQLIFHNPFDAKSAIYSIHLGFREHKISWSNY
ncbi:MULTISPECIES: hypothetical protein [unclassified Polaribacter]|uniref:hypothetical protein n=1 Tax=unclassified Polaribacter TaxID=196858 RepID=UPI0011BFA4EE|nr:MULTISPECIES: hypothetical protein [unclassified Polaribacter]TXD50461.1 hypothetical protein ES043_15840 [Polaribacter sp. IC063]TXD56883.1 hypothetical protein ES044_16120 [Polaribacter sp. IC066]